MKFSLRRNSHPRTDAVSPFPDANIRRCKFCKKSVLMQNTRIWVHANDLSPHCFSSSAGQVATPE